MSGFAFQDSATEIILKVAVPTPVHQCFDYRWRPGPANVRPRVGARVKVPFGRGQRIGVIVSLAGRSEIRQERLKSAFEVLDSSPLLGPELLRLLTWASDYYHHPLGEVIAATLPALLRRGRPAETPKVRLWGLSESGARIDTATLARAPRQATLMAMLAAHGRAASRSELGLSAASWGPVLRRLKNKGWICAEDVETGRPDTGTSLEISQPKVLESSQVAALDAIAAQPDGFQAFLLHGVTGSGKTEVYLALIEQVLARGKQAVVLIPEIGLTPQTVARFSSRLKIPLSVMHSGLSDGERMRAWLMAKDGRAGVVIGTRSAILSPLMSPGIFIVDEEHDMSYKQQDGFRYSARDLAVVRARQSEVPVVLGSATPSLESLHNVSEKRYFSLRLPKRAAGAKEPEIRVLDVRGRALLVTVCPVSCWRRCQTIWTRQEQSLLFLNRRGYAPVLMCHECGWVADCPRCDAHMVVHLGVEPAQVSSLRAGPSNPRRLSRMRGWSVSSGSWYAAYCASARRAVSKGANCASGP